MEELNCGMCRRHLGWMNYCGPHGTVYCDECKEAEDREEEERREAGRNDDEFED